MTISIVARCARTGQLGVAAATAMPAVGKLLAHALPHTGAVATQGLVNPYLGFDGLRLLAQRLSAHDVAELLKRSDPRIELRQFAVMDGAGRPAAFTGHECPAWAGHHLGEQLSVQGNRLAGPEVVRAAVETLERTRAQPLAERLVEALEAAEAAGGDAKGEESATLYVVDTEEYPLWDIRVDLHAAPVTELRRLYEIFLGRLLPHVERMPTRRNPGGDVDESSV